MNTVKKAKLGILFITILWALAPSFLKLSLVELQVFNLTAIRFILSFMVLTIIFFNKVRNVTKDTLKKSFFLSIVLMMVFVTMTYGVQFTTASKAGFLTCLSVVFVPPLTFVFFKRKPEVRILFGILITLTGIGMMTLKSDLSMNLGDLLCVAGSGVYGLYMMMMEKYASECEPISLSVVQMGYIAIYSSVFCLLFETPKLPTMGVTWFAVLFMAFVCTAISFLIQTLCQKYTTAEDFAIINTLEPLFASVFAYLILRELLSEKEFIGAFVLLVGVAFTQFNPRNLFKKKVY